MRPQIFHITHIDRLQSILEEGCLFSDREVGRRQLSGTKIGFPHIKRRRSAKQLLTKPELTVGECVPFYFCPRSVMLYVIHKRNLQDLPYSGGQEPVIHFRGYLQEAVEWAEESDLHWAFTSINAADQAAEDWDSLDELNRINWEIVYDHEWRGNRSAKQAEFLVEQRFPSSLFNCIGVHNQGIKDQAEMLLSELSYDMPVCLKPNWYY